MRLKGMICDLDGTLLDTLPVCYLSFRAVFRRYLNRDYSDREIDQLFGPSEEGIFKRLVPDKWEDCLATYLATYDKVHPEYAQPFPGIAEALDLLQKRRVKLAIVSGKGPRSMELSLKHSGLAQYFEVVETGSEQGPVKPLRIKKVLEIWGCDPSEVAYLGDTPQDMKDSHEVGTISLAAAWSGTARTEGISDTEAVATFAQVKDFRRWIEENVEFT
ncbi:HAD-like domain protein [Acididesulfobacillus acetoxydans]|uniref:HAD-like domain protein n=1 Tax=Acididesulfobacillus acetoxydans TaxID=1561005 RepID=A0A8S0XAK5_9FIRM|nr:HAD family hydrolase [Acididesulfobacillus acetoxydans]CAA7600006.1 HAD-like domain protein [Acididesulfobacillus acetoxydans]CEJ05992.1 HAD-super hydrolase, sub IA, variant 1 [Acididesulfobacillus acetoxydans]